MKETGIETKTHLTYSSYRRVNDMAINLLCLEALKLIRILPFFKVHISKFDMFKETLKDSQSLKHATQFLP